MTTSAEDAAPKGEVEDVAEGSAGGASAREVDLRGWERAASAGLGAYLVVGGLRRRSWLGLASAATGGALLYRGLSGRGPLSGGATDAESTVYRPEDPEEAVGSVQRTITVERPAEELAEYWRDADQLSRLLDGIVEVSDAGGNRRRWAIEGPMGRSVSWETRTMLDRPGEELRWRSVGDAVVPNEWTVRFEEAPGGERTRVTLSVSVDPPGGAVGRAVAGRLLPASLLGTVLDRFKSLAETGEIPTLEKNPSARGQGDRI